MLYKSLRMEVKPSLKTNPSTVGTVLKRPLTKAKDIQTMSLDVVPELFNVVHLFQGGP